MTVFFGYQQDKPPTKIFITGAYLIMNDYTSLPHSLSQLTMDYEDEDHDGAYGYADSKAGKGH